MTLNFPREFIDEVKARSKILDVAESCGLELIKSNGIYQANCIHTGDSTPSLTFYPDTNTYFCFGCRSGGDVIQFKSWINDIPFYKAVEALAKDLNMKMEFAPNQLEEVSRTYWRTLQKDDETLSYLASRNILQPDIDKWRLGLVPSGTYAGRVSFTIQSESGGTVGFAFRSLTDKPKYINSVESEVFQKRKLLYGLHNLRRAKYLVLVEGYTDVIQLQKYDVPAVGLMGSALTKEQVALLTKHTDDIIVMMDADLVGQNAAQQIAKELKANKIKVRVVMTTEDPDELAIRYKEKAYSYIQSVAMPVPGYMINLELASHKAQVDTLTLDAINKLLPTVVEFTNPVETEYYIGRISEELKVGTKEIYRMLAKGDFYGYGGALRKDTRAS